MIEISLKLKGVDLLKRKKINLKRKKKKDKLIKVYNKAIIRLKKTKQI
jgi:hypothetical protein